MVFHISPLHPKTRVKVSIVMVTWLENLRVIINVTDAVMSSRENVIKIIIICHRVKHFSATNKLNGENNLKDHQPSSRFDFFTVPILAYFSYIEVCCHLFWSCWFSKNISTWAISKSRGVIHTNTLSYMMITAWHKLSCRMLSSVDTFHKRSEEFFFIIAENLNLFQIEILLSCKVGEI